MKSAKHSNALGVTLWTWRSPFFHAYVHSGDFVQSRNTCRRPAVLEHLFVYPGYNIDLSRKYKYNVILPKTGCVDYTIRPGLWIAAFSLHQVGTETGSKPLETFIHSDITMKWVTRPHRPPWTGCRPVPMLNLPWGCMCCELQATHAQ